jgi:hypothetical protein
VIQAFFPDRYIALAIPLVFMTLLIGVNLIFIGFTLVLEPQNNKHNVVKLNRR